MSTKKDYRKQAVELILDEVNREHSKAKSPEEDAKYNSKEQLRYGALYCLTKLDAWYPTTWNHEFKKRVDNTSTKRNLTFAANLIVSELARLLYNENTSK